MPRRTDTDQVPPREDAKAAALSPATPSPLATAKPAGKKRYQYKTKSNGKNDTGTKAVKYDERLPEMVRKMCEVAGATNDDLAKILGVDVSTIKRWMEEYPEFKAAIKTGRDEYDSGRIKVALRDRALGYNWEERTVEQTEIKAEKLVKDATTGEYVVARDSQGKKVTVMVPATKTKVTNKHVPAEPVCMFFWLTNRQKKDWAHMARTIVQGDPANPVSYKLDVDLTKLPAKELDNLESIIARAKAEQRVAAENASDGPKGTA